MPPQVITGRPEAVSKELQRHVWWGLEAFRTDLGADGADLPCRVEQIGGPRIAGAGTRAALPQQERSPAISLKLLLPIFEHVLVEGGGASPGGTSRCPVDSLLSIISTFHSSPFCSSSCISVTHETGKCGWRQR